MLEIYMVGFILVVERIMVELLLRWMVYDVLCGEMVMFLMVVDRWGRVFVWLVLIC